MHSIDWLVRGAVNGDVLFFVCESELFDII